MYGQKPRHDPERATCRRIPRLGNLQSWRSAAVLAPLARRAARHPVPPYRQILDSLDLPEPFELTVFLARVAGLRGRDIYVQSFTARHGLCGAWIRTRHADYLYHDQHTTSVHQAHILVHEIAHMLLGHERDGASATDLSELLTPSSGDHRIAALNGRCTASTSARECEAETLASIILERSAWQESPARAKPGTILSRPAGEAERPGM